MKFDMYASFTMLFNFCSLLHLIQAIFKFLKIMQPHFDSLSWQYGLVKKILPHSKVAFFSEINFNEVKKIENYRVRSNMFLKINLTLPTHLLGLTLVEVAYKFCGRGGGGWFNPPFLYAR